jgi:hypothetical protein
VLQLTALMSVICSNLSEFNLGLAYTFDEFNPRLKV